EASAPGAGTAVARSTTWRIAAVVGSKTTRFEHVGALSEPPAFARAKPRWSLATSRSFRKKPKPTGWATSPALPRLSTRSLARITVVAYGAEGSGGRAERAPAGL